jgi:hypothetical protein
MRVLNIINKMVVENEKEEIFVIENGPYTTVWSKFGRGVYFFLNYT